ncbi:MAG: MTH1187 family thiamine-binding protein [Myxococcota bacterium]
MAIAAVSISPVGAGVSVSKYVAAAIAVLEAQDRVRWQLDSMFTTLEGEPAELFGLIEKMQAAVFAAGAVRVGTVVKMDERRDRPDVHMEDKVRAVRERLRAGDH